MNWKSKNPGNTILQIVGQYNYHVDVQIKGQFSYHSCNISVNCYSKTDKRIAIATKCKWFRVKGADRCFQLIGVSSNTYQCSGQDIGSSLKIEIYPQEDDFSGIATVLFGPITLDPALRQSLEQVLNQSGQSFPIMVFFSEGETEVQGQGYQGTSDEMSKLTNTLQPQQQLATQGLTIFSNETTFKENGTLMLTMDYIRISSFLQSQTLNEKREKSVKFKYSLDIPLIEVNFLDVNKLAFVFRGNEEEFEQLRHFLGLRQSIFSLSGSARQPIQKLGLQQLQQQQQQQQIVRLAFKTASRSQRDLILLAIKCFAAKSYLINSQAISNIDFALETEEQQSGGGFTNLLSHQQSSSQHQRLFGEALSKNKLKGDLLLEIESIKKELNQVLLLNKDLVKEKEGLTKEIKKLEQELNDTIQTYQKLIVDISSGEGTEGQSSSQQQQQLKASMILKKEDIDLRKKVQQIEKEKKDLEVKMQLMNEEIEVLKALQNGGGGGFGAENFSNLGGGAAGFFEESKILFKSMDLISEIESPPKCRDSVLAARNKELERAIKLQQQTIDQLKGQTAQLESQLRQSRLANNFVQKQQEPIFSSVDIQTHEPSNVAQGLAEGVNSATFKQMNYQIEMLQIEVNTYRTKAETLQRQMDKRESQIKKEKKQRLGELQQSLYNNNIKTIEQMLEESLNQNELLKRELEQTKAAMMQTQTASKDVEKLLHELNNAQARISQLEQCEIECKSQRARAEDLERELAALRTLAEQRQQMVTSSVVSATQIGSRVRELEGQLVEQGVKLDQLRGELMGAELRIQQLTKEKELLAQEAQMQVSRLMQMHYSSNGAEIELIQMKKQLQMQQEQLGMQITKVTEQESVLQVKEQTIILLQQQLEAAAAQAIAKQNQEWQQLEFNMALEMQKSGFDSPSPSKKQMTGFNECENENKNSLATYAIVAQKNSDIVIDQQQIPGCFGEGIGINNSKAGEIKQLQLKIELLCKENEEKGQQNIQLLAEQAQVRVEYEEKISHLSQQLVSLNEQYQVAVRELEANKSAVRGNSVNSSAIEASMIREQAQRQVEILESEMVMLRQTNQQAIQENQSLHNKYQGLLQEYDSLSVRARQMQEEMDDLKNKSMVSISREGENTLIQQQLQAVQVEVITLKQRLESQGVENGQLQQQLDAMKQQVDALLKTNANLMLENNNICEQLKVAQSNNNSFMMNSSNSIVVAKVNEKEQKIRQIFLEQIEQLKSQLQGALAGQKKAEMDVNILREQVQRYQSLNIGSLEVNSPSKSQVIQLERQRNEKLINENVELMQRLKKYEDEIESLQNMSRLRTSFAQSEGEQMLKENIQLSPIQSVIAVHQEPALLLGSSAHLQRLATSAVGNSSLKKKQNIIREDEQAFASPSANNDRQNNQCPCPGLINNFNIYNNGGEGSSSSQKRQQKNKQQQSFCKLLEEVVEVENNIQGANKNSQQLQLMKKQQKKQISQNISGNVSGLLLGEDRKLQDIIQELQQVNNNLQMKLTESQAKCMNLENELFNLKQEHAMNSASSVLEQSSYIIQNQQINKELQLLRSENECLGQQVAYLNQQLCTTGNGRDERVKRSTQKSQENDEADKRIMLLQVESQEQRTRADQLQQELRERQVRHDLDITEYRLRIGSLEIELSRVKQEEQDRLLEEQKCRKAIGISLEQKEAEVMTLLQQVSELQVHCQNLQLEAERLQMERSNQSAMDHSFVRETETRHANELTALRNEMEKEVRSWQDRVSQLVQQFQREKTQALRECEQTFAGERENAQKRETILTSTIAELKAQIANLQLESEQQRLELLEQQQNNCSMLREQMEEEKNTLTSELKAQLLIREQWLEKQAKEMQELQQQVECLRNEAKTGTADIRQRLERCQQQVSDLQTKCANLVLENERLNMELQNNSLNNSLLIKESHQQKEQEIAQREKVLLETHQKERQAAEQKIDALRSELDNTKQRFQSILIELDGQMQQNQNQISQLQQEYLSLQQKEQLNTGIISELRAQVANLQLEKEQMELERQNQSALNHSFVRELESGKDAELHELRTQLQQQSVQITQAAQALREREAQLLTLLERQREIADEDKQKIQETLVRVSADAEAFKLQYQNLQIQLEQMELDRQNQSAINHSFMRELESGQETALREQCEQIKALQEREAQLLVLLEKQRTGAEEDLIQARAERKVALESAESWKVQFTNLQIAFEQLEMERQNQSAANNSFIRELESGKDNELNALRTQLIAIQQNGQERERQNIALAEQLDKARKECQTLEEANNELKTKNANLQFEAEQLQLDKLNLSSIDNSFVRELEAQKEQEIGQTQMQILAIQQEKEVMQTSITQLQQALANAQANHISQIEQIRKDQEQMYQQKELEYIQTKQQEMQLLQTEIEGERAEFKEKILQIQKALDDFYQKKIIDIQEELKCQLQAALGANTELQNENQTLQTALEERTSQVQQQTRLLAEIQVQSQEQEQNKLKKQAEEFTRQMKMALEQEGQKVAAAFEQTLAAKESENKANVANLELEIERLRLEKANTSSINESFLREVTAEEQQRHVEDLQRCEEELIRRQTEIQRLTVELQRSQEEIKTIKEELRNQLGVNLRIQQQLDENNQQARSTSEQQQHPIEQVKRSRLSRQSSSSSLEGCQELTSQQDEALREGMVNELRLDFSRQLEKSQQEVQAMKQRMQMLCSELQQKEMQSQMLEAKNQAQQTELQKAEHYLTDITEQRQVSQRLQQDNRMLQESIQSLRANMEASLQEAKTQCGNLQQEVEHLRKENESLHELIAQGEEQLRQLQKTNQMLECECLQEVQQVQLQSKEALEIKDQQHLQIVQELQKTLDQIRREQSEKSSQLQTQYEANIRNLNNQLQQIESTHEAQKKQAESTYQSQLKQAETTHENQLKQVETTYETQFKEAETVHKLQVEELKVKNANLELELEKQRQELLNQSSFLREEEEVQGQRREELAQLLQQIQMLTAEKQALLQNQRELEEANVQYSAIAAHHAEEIEAMRVQAEENLQVVAQRIKQVYITEIEENDAQLKEHIQKTQQLQNLLQTATNEKKNLQRSTEAAKQKGLETVARLQSSKANLERQIQEVKQQNNIVQNALEEIKQTSFAALKEAVTKCEGQQSILLQLEKDLQAQRDKVQDSQQKMLSQVQVNQRLAEENMRLAKQVTELMDELDDMRNRSFSSSNGNQDLNSSYLSEGNRTKIGGDSVTSSNQEEEIMSKKKLVAEYAATKREEPVSQLKRIEVQCLEEKIRNQQQKLNEVQEEQNQISERLLLFQLGLQKVNVLQNETEERFKEKQNAKQEYQSKVYELEQILQQEKESHFNQISQNKQQIDSLQSQLQSSQTQLQQLQNQSNGKEQSLTQQIQVSEFKQREQEQLLESIKQLYLLSSKENEELLQQKTQLQNEIENISKQYLDQIAQITQERDRLLADLENNSEEHLKKNLLFQKEIDQIKTQNLDKVAQIEQERNSLSEQLSGMKEDLQKQYHSEIESMKAQISQEIQEKNQLTEDLANTRQEIQRWSKEKEDEAQQYKQEIEHLQCTANAIQIEKEALQIRCQLLNAELKKYQEKTQNLIEKVQALQQDQSNITTDNQQLNESLENLSSELLSVKGQLLREFENSKANNEKQLQLIRDLSEQQQQLIEQKEKQMESQSEKIVNLSMALEHREAKSAQQEKLYQSHVNELKQEIEEIKVSQSLVLDLKGRIELLENEIVQSTQALTDSKSDLALQVECNGLIKGQLEEATRHGENLQVEVQAIATKLEEALNQKQCLEEKIILMQITTNAQLQDKESSSQQILQESSQAISQVQQSYQQQLEEIQEQNKQKLSEVEEEFGRQKEDYFNKLKTIEELYAQLQTENQLKDTRLEELIAKDQQEIATLQALKTSLQEKVNNLTEEINKYQNNIIQLQDSNKKDIQELESQLQIQLNNKESELANIIQENKALQLTINECNYKNELVLTELQQALKNQQNQCRDLEDKLSLIKQEKESVTQKVDDKERLCQQLKDELDTLRNNDIPKMELAQQLIYSQLIEQKKQSEEASAQSKEVKDQIILKDQLISHLQEEQKKLQTDILALEEQLCIQKNTNQENQQILTLKFKENLETQKKESELQLSQLTAKLDECEKIRQDLQNIGKNNQDYFQQQLLQKQQIVNGLQQRIRELSQDSSQLNEQLIQNQNRLANYQQNFNKFCSEKQLDIFQLKQKNNQESIALQNEIQSIKAEKIKLAYDFEDLQNNTVANLQKNLEACQNIIKNNAGLVVELQQQHEEQLARCQAQAQAEITIEKQELEKLQQSKQREHELLIVTMRQQIQLLEDQNNSQAKQLQDCNNLNNQYKQQIEYLQILNKESTQEKLQTIQKQEEQINQLQIQASQLQEKYDILLIQEKTAADYRVQVQQLLEQQISQNKVFVIEYEQCKKMNEQLSEQIKALITKCNDGKNTLVLQFKNNKMQRNLVSSIKEKAEMKLIINNLNESNSQLSSCISRYEIEWNHYSQEKEKYLQQLSAYQTRLNKLELAQAKQIELSEEFARIQQTSMELNNQVNQYKNAIQQFQLDASREKELILKEHQKQIQEMNQTQAKLHLTISDLEDKVILQTQQIIQFSDINDRQLDQLQSKEKLIIELEQSNNDLKNNIVQLNQLLDLKEENVQELKSELDLSTQQQSQSIVQLQKQISQQYKVEVEVQEAKWTNTIQQEISKLNEKELVIANLQARIQEQQEQSEQQINHLQKQLEQEKVKNIAASKDIEDCILQYQKQMEEQAQLCHIKEEAKLAEHKELSAKKIRDLQESWQIEIDTLEQGFTKKLQDKDDIIIKMGKETSELHEQLQVQIKQLQKEKSEISLEKLHAIQTLSEQLEKMKAEFKFQCLQAEKMKEEQLIQIEKECHQKLKQRDEDLEKKQQIILSIQAEVLRMERINEDSNLNHTTLLANSQESYSNLQREFEQLNKDQQKIKADYELQLEQLKSLHKKEVDEQISLKEQIKVLNQQLTSQEQDFNQLMKEKDASYQLQQKLIEQKMEEMKVKVQEEFASHIALLKEQSEKNLNQAQQTYHQKEEELNQSLIQYKLQHEAEFSKLLLTQQQEFNSIQSQLSTKETELLSLMNQVDDLKAINLEINQSHSRQIEKLQGELSTLLIEKQQNALLANEKLQAAQIVLESVKSENSSHLQEIISQNENQIEMIKAEALQNIENCKQTFANKEQKLLTSISDLQTLLEQSKQALNACQNDYNQKQQLTEQELQSKTSQINNLEFNLHLLEEKTRNQEQNIGSLQQTNQLQVNINETMQKETLDLQSQLKSLTLTLEEQNKETSITKQIVQNMQISNKNLINENTHLQEQLNKLQDELDDIKNKSINASFLEQSFEGKKETDLNQNEGKTCNNNNLLQNLEKEESENVPDLVQNSKAIIDNLRKTNEKILQENALLTQQVQKLQEDLLNNSSRLDQSNYSDINEENSSLREKINELESMVSALSKDKANLQIEMQKIQQQQQQSTNQPGSSSNQAGIKKGWFK